MASCEREDEEQVTTFLDEMIPFHDFADVLEKVSNDSSTPKKIRRLERFIAYFRTKFLELHGTLESNDRSNGDSVFSIIRLLYPAGDKKRAAYNFKAVALSRMFARILGLDKNSPDGKKLLDYKDPIKAGIGAADLGTTVFGVLKSRCSESSAKQPKEKDAPMISELHSVLDRLARGQTASETVTQEKQVKVLQGFVRRLTPLEGKWLVRILLKNLYLNVNKNQIFKLIHPKAAELLNSMDLETVCRKLNNPSASLTDKGVSDLALFGFFKPMLCSRLDKVDEGNASNNGESGSSLVKSPKKTQVGPVELPDPPLILETKFDGERCQIHYEYNCDADTPEEMHTFKYFSRRAIDNTLNFKETFTSRFVNQIIRDPPVLSFILDGEMMAWQRRTKSFKNKGDHVDVKTLTVNDENSPLYVAFDIVYYNGQVLVDTPLSERKEILKQVLIPDEETVRLSEVTIVQDKASVTDALNEAIDNLEEGLVVKTMDSSYEPGKRARSWLKIKPEYIEGHAVDDLDMLILGAYYTDSVQHSRGKITNFLVGVIGEKNEFYAVGTVGMGKLNYQQRGELVSSLKELFVGSGFSSVKYGRKKKPDLFIDPKKSIVLQVKASEIIHTEMYDSKYTLRFPRVSSVRLDKPWEDAMTLKELHDLRESSHGKLAKKSGSAGIYHGRKDRQVQEKDAGNSSDDGTRQVPLKSKSGLKLATSSRTRTNSPKKSFLGGGARSLMSKTKSSVFAGYVFCVIASDTWTTEVTQLLKANGAKEIVMNPTSDTHCIIAEKESWRVKNYEKDGSYDIANGRSFVDKCIAATKVLNFQPEDLFFAKASTKESFSTEYDKFGDSYTKPSSVDEVKVLIQNIMDQEDIDVDGQSTKKTEDLTTMKRELNSELFPSDSKSPPKRRRWSFLNDCKIAFRGEIPGQNNLELQVEFYGGDIAQSEQEPGITHVIVGKGGKIMPNKSATDKMDFSIRYVNPNWLLESLAEFELKPAIAYSASLH